MKINKLNVMLIITLLLASCGGRTPNPEPVKKLGDSSLSCRSIEREVDIIDSKIRKLLPDSQKTGKNVALGVGGVILWPAWLFMDFSDAEKLELEALQARHNHLVDIYHKKKCER